MAWVAAVLILQSGMPPGLVVGVTVFILCMAAHVKLLSSIPASVYGYAATFAILLIDAQRFALAALTEVSLHRQPAPPGCRFDDCGRTPRVRFGQARRVMTRQA